MLVALLALAALAWADPVVVLPMAHAHNDYKHERPLLDALDHGFGSVEADVWLVDGVLYVAHDRDEVRKGRTLESLYLIPLDARVRENGGSVYPGGEGLLLVIDVKAEPGKVYDALKTLLAKYASMLTVFRGDTIETRGVTVVLSGERPRKRLAADPERSMAMEGFLEDLDEATPVTLAPVVSDDWTLNFRWYGDGALPDRQLHRLERLAKKARDQGRRLRFWSAPDKPNAWKTLLDAGVGLIGTDDLDGLQTFLLGRVRPPKAEPAKPLPEAGSVRF